MAARRRRTGAPSRARCRGGVPPLSLQRPPRGPLLAGRRRPQHARPLAVRPAERAGVRQGRRRQMDRRRHRRAWRSARRHPRELRPCRLPRRRRRGAALPQPAATRAGAGTRRIDRRRRRRDRRKRHGGSSPCRSRLRAQSWKRICANAALRLCTEPEASASIRAATTARTRHAPTETWPAMIAAVTDLDGKITGAHRTWLDPSGRDKAPIDTPRRAMGHLLGQRRPLRRGGRRHGGRRRHRDHAVAAHASADHADGRRALGRTPRRHPVPGDAAPALHRPRRRSGRRRRDGDA